MRRAVELLLARPFDPERPREVVGLLDPAACWVRPPMVEPVQRADCVAAPAELHEPGPRRLTRLHKHPAADPLAAHAIRWTGCALYAPEQRLAALSAHEIQAAPAQLDPARPRCAPCPPGAALLLARRLVMALWQAVSGRTPMDRPREPTRVAARAVWPR